MKKPVYLLILTCIYLHGYSQDQGVIDSLQACLKTEKQDTTRANIFLELAKACQFDNSDMALNFAKQSLAVSEQCNFKKGISNAYNAMGNIKEAAADYSSAIGFYKESLRINEEIGNKKEIARCYNRIAINNKRLGSYAEALKYYFDGLEICQAIGYKKGISAFYGNIAIIYQIQGKFSEALNYQLESLKISEETGDKQGTSESYLNIGEIYNHDRNYSEALKNFTSAYNLSKEIGYKAAMAQSYLGMGNIYFNQNNYSEALKDFMEYARIAEETGNKQFISNSLFSIGTVYQAQGNYLAALNYQFKALRIEEEIGDVLSRSKSLLNIGISYSYLKEYKKANEYMNEALASAREVNSLDDIYRIYHSMANLDSMQGNFKMTFENYKSAIVARDSLFNIENAKKMTQQQMQYDFDKKEALSRAEQEKKDAIAIKELQKQKLVRNSFVGGFAVVLLFAGVFFNQRNKIKIGKKRSDELLLNILPEEVAEELKAKGSADAKLIDDVTVLFTDFKGFTQLSEKLTPKELVAEINECFSAFDHIMLKYGVEKIKTIGDSYMAAGGVPTPNNTHASDVVKAALDIRQYMKEYKEKKDATGNLSFEIRIGVHTGPVVAGIVGVKKFAYDIWGDTVNTASRMESSGEPDKVNISGITYESVKDEFNCIHRGKVMAKGKGEVDMYFVESKHPHLV
jgi:adenylate cyclase